MANHHYCMLIEVVERDLLITELMIKNKPNPVTGDDRSLFNLFINTSQMKLGRLYRQKMKLVNKNKYNWCTVLRESKMNK